MTGDYDLSTGDGRFKARIEGAVAAKDVDLEEMVILHWPPGAPRAAVRRIFALYLRASEPGWTKTAGPLDFDAVTGEALAADAGGMRWE